MGRVALHHQVVRHVISPKIRELQAQINALSVAIGGVVEGTYTTWTIQAIYDTGVPHDYDDLVGVMNDGKILFNDCSLRRTYVIDHDGTLLHTLADQYPGQSSWGSPSSILGRYNLIRDEATGHVANVITVEGTLWSRNIENDRGVHVLSAENIKLFSISPSGEWLLVVARDNAANALIFIYRGS